MSSEFVYPPAGPVLINPAGAATTLWVPSPQRVSIAPGVCVPLSQKRSRVSFMTVFADQANSVTVTIGPPGLNVPTNSVPNIAFFQLDAGRSATIWTDNIYTEFFDMHDFCAAHADGTNTCFVYVTIYRAVLLGVSA